MSHYRWLARRRAVKFASAVLVLALSTFLFAGCGLFGGDDEETPQVVEPPAETAQNADDQSAAVATGDAVADQQQQAQPTEAVSVTTSPSDDEEEQAAQPQSETTEPEQEGDPSVYIVQPGDTLAAIANRLGVRIDDLITLNGIQNPDLISVGQELKIPGVTLSDAEEDGDAAESAEEAEDQQEEEDEQIEPPSVELPTVAVPAATPTRVTYTQFPQPGPEQTSDTIPDAPANFLQYGAAALPWLHGVNEVEPIIELFKAWPMPSLAVGNDRVVLIDTSGDGNFSASIVYTDPNSFGAAVPFSNLVVYDPVPGDLTKYRIAYDHAQAYAREVQGIQQISDADLTGDFFRDLTFREITCDESGCVSSFYILSSTGDGYRTVTGSVAQVAAVSAIRIEDMTGDGVPDIVVNGLATDQATAARYTFVFSARGDELIESVRLSLDGGGSDDVAEEAETDDEEEEDSLEE
ncbi:MAG: LysM peptidoglycan-binding domain-containing protein [Chloroflexi bacterium]|nr:LysM peptidoglycan-binding domain-containing protein [Chloroflexota bacterium]MYJ58594.1 LysM peptidoglycan-binding domain-containing protein [Chloroflexota bacterium]